jgi:type I site-specific restriction-modification system R (restriction) subunit
MRDHTLLQAIARVNRPYENEQAELVKPHGFVLDFVGIFDNLENPWRSTAMKLTRSLKTWIC